LTPQRQFRWGQAPLFVADAADGSRRYRVFNGATWGPATTSLTLAVAQARAVVLTGRRALVWADDGTGVSLTHGRLGFALNADGPVTWAAQCRFLLDRHG
jgi:hypothetical protein